MNCLSQLKPGEFGEVIKLSGENGIKRRLEDLGLVEGTRVECIQRSALGDPTAYSIRGAVIALREEDCQGIIIK